MCSEASVTRYAPNIGPGVGYCGMAYHPHGDYILHSDHLTALSALQSERDRLSKDLDTCNTSHGAVTRERDLMLEQIHLLNADREGLSAVLEKAEEDRNDLDEKFSALCGLVVDEAEMLRPDPPMPQKAIHGVLRLMRQLSDTEINLGGMREAVRDREKETLAACAEADELRASAEALQSRADTAERRVRKLERALDMCAISASKAGRAGDLWPAEIVTICRAALTPPPEPPHDDR